MQSKPERLAVSREHNVHPVYRPDIDGLRAVAILSVVIFHAFPTKLRGGFIGVDVFFVISGFLISSIIFRSLQRGDFSFSEFYANRINRIFPALLVVLTSAMIFGWFALLPDEFKQLGKHIAAGSGFVQNIVLWNEAGYFDKASELKPMMHLWSLAIEEQFYLIYPLLIWGMWRLRFNLLAIVASIGLLSFTLNVTGIREDVTKTFFLPHTRFWELLAGSVLAYFHLFKGVPSVAWLRQSFSCNRDNFQPTSISAHRNTLLENTLSWIGLLLILAANFGLHEGKTFPGWWALAPVAGAFLLIMTGPAAWVNRHILANRFLVFVGLISYPLYLWHWPILTFARIMESGTPSSDIRIAAVALSFLLAWGTYIFIEKKIRFGRKSYVKTVALALVMGTVGCAGFGVFREDGFPERAIVHNNYVQHAQVENPYLPCSTDPAYELVGKYCKKYQLGSNQETVVLWGDSSTRYWEPVFLDIGRSAGHTLINISHPSCPPILEARKTHFDYLESKIYCSDGEIQRQALKLIGSLRPDVVVLISAWNSYSPSVNKEFIADRKVDEANQITTTDAIRMRVPETIIRLSQIGRVIVFKSWPMLSEPPKYEVRRIAFLQSKRELNFVRKTDFDKDSELINSVFDKIQDPNLAYFDPSRKICADLCSPVLDGIRLYSDAYHITPEGAQLFKAELAELLQSDAHKAGR